MTAFRELMAVPVQTSDPCVEISREGVACPDEPIVSNNAEDGGDSGAVTNAMLAVSAVAGAAVTALLM